MFGRYSPCAARSRSGAFLRQRTHQPVARHFGDDGRGRDRLDHSVAADHSLALTQGTASPIAAIDEHVLRGSGQSPAARAPAPRRCTQDIVAIDPRRRGERHRRRDAVAQIFSNNSSRSSAELSRLESSMPFGMRSGIEDHGRRHHGPGQRPAPGLVATSHRPYAALDQRALALDSAAPPRSRPSAARACRSPFRSFSLRPESSGDSAQALPAAQPGTPAPKSAFTALNKRSFGALTCPNQADRTRRSPPTVILGATTTSQGWPSGSQKYPE